MSNSDRIVASKSPDEREGPRAMSTRGDSVSSAAPITHPSESPRDASSWSSRRASSPEIPHAPASLQMDWPTSDPMIESRAGGLPPWRALRVWVHSRD
jgi:hypothetical protein